MATDRGKLTAMLGRRSRKPGRGYSVFVRSMKTLLPLTAAALALVVVIWPEIDPGELNIQKAEPEIKPEDAQSLRMVELRFIGVDDQGAPYSITADEAEQTPGSDSRVRLEKPQGDMTLEDGRSLEVVSDFGYFDRLAQRLDLMGNVHLNHELGYQLNARDTQLNLEAGTATSALPVTGRGPAGELSGASFRVENRGQTLILNGPARVVINPGALE